MAIPSYANSEIQTSGVAVDTFQSWIDKTNNVFADLSTVVMTTDSTANGAVTTGNAHIEGILSANTLAADVIRGGDVGSSGDITMTSGLTINATGSFRTFADIAVEMRGSINFNGANKAFTSNNLTSTFNGDTFTANGVNFNVKSSNMTIESATTISGSLTTGDIVTGDVTANNVTAEDITATGIVHFDSTGAIQLPTGSTAQRGTAVTGMLRYNTDLNRVEAYDNDSWVQLYQKISKTATAPTSAQEGDIWFDTDNGVLKYYDASSWVSVEVMTANSTTLSTDKDLEVDGDITATGDITGLSDARVKENIVVVDNAINKVMTMRGVYYNKIGEVERKIGVIAQEVELVVPELVQTNDEGMKSVAYGNALGLIIEAIRELKLDIEELKNGKDTHV